MAQSEEIIIYYDASCAFCSTEIHNIKRYDDHETITLVDCSDEVFDASVFKDDHITRQAMMNALHVRDGRDQWHIGVAAFEKMYDHIGFEKVAKLCRHPITKPIAVKLYPIIVRNRYILSKLGLVQMLEWWGKVAAKRAHQRVGACKDESCKR